MQRSQTKAGESASDTNSDKKSGQEFIARALKDGPKVKISQAKDPKTQINKPQAPKEQSSKASVLKAETKETPAPAFIYQGPIVRKVFWENPYQHILQTKVAAVNGNEVVFADTIAYSFSGGQHDDQAKVNGKPILKSRMDKAAPFGMYYTFAEGHGFKIDDAVTMEIDWERRYRLMRLHFTAEITLEVVTQKYNLTKVGADIESHRARIDFKCPYDISTKFPEIYTDFNKIIESNLKIKKDYDDKANQRRFWQIEGFSLVQDDGKRIESTVKVPCGGTHVESTAEVGFVKLERPKPPNKGVERIYMTLVDDGTEEYKNQAAATQVWKESLEARKSCLSTLFSSRGEKDQNNLAKITNLITEFEVASDVAVGFKTTKRF